MASFQIPDPSLLYFADADEQTSDKPKLHNGAPSLAVKNAFFEGLYALNDDSDQYSVYDCGDNSEYKGAFSARAKPSLQTRSLSSGSFPVMSSSVPALNTVQVQVSASSLVVPSADSQSIQDLESFFVAPSPITPLPGIPPVMAMSSGFNREYGIKRTPDACRSNTEPAVRVNLGLERVEETPIIGRPARLNPTKTPTGLIREIPIVEETPYDLIRETPLRPRRTVSAPMPSTGGLSGFDTSTLGKRKRNGVNEVELKPEKDRIFGKCVFFYVPNDDKNKVRRTRIMRAREYGATWTTQWIPSITHIVVDAKLSYKDVISFLRIPSIPNTMKLVNETYPLDCISWMRILDLPQNQYEVQGSVKLPESNKSIVSQKSEGSSKLKTGQSKPGRWDHVPPRATPPRSEYSSLEEPPIENSRMLNHSSSDPGSSRLSEMAIFDNVEDGIDEQNVINHRIESTKWIKHGDELDAAIGDALEAKNLPLDNDEDRPSSRDSVDLGTPNDSDEHNSPPLSSPQRLFVKKKSTGTEQFFSCMKGGTGQQQSDSPNAHTISVLEDMATIYLKTGEQWRPNAYRKVITYLKQEKEKIATAEKALKIPGCGKRLAAKIEEIVTTGSLRRLESAKDDPVSKILEIFINIYGVGPCQAYKWIAQGYKTLEDLTTHVTLTDNQLVGIAHYDDFLNRIPREEVTALSSIVTAAGVVIDPAVQFIIGGSYRRGALSSGDIDLIVTKPGTSASSDIKPFLDALTASLTASGFLVHALTHSSDQSSSKWHGCCLLPSDPAKIWRRIDFLLVPESELGAALIYFTGNDIFNRSIRLLASKKGMRLNQRGLFKDVMRGPGRIKINEGELVEGRDERRIFEILGVQWRPPGERFC